MMNLLPSLVKCDDHDYRDTTTANEVHEVRLGEDNDDDDDVYITPKFADSTRM